MGTQISKVGSTTLEVGITPITSGAVGRVLFQGTGNVLGESSSLFWDNTNGRLGVRNSTPTASLHIVGSGTTSGTASFVSQNSTGAINATINDEGYWFLGVPNNRLASAPGEFNFNSPGGTMARIGQYSMFFTPGASGTASLQIASNFQLLGANVLIGTTTDGGYKLDVNGISRFISAVYMDNVLHVNTIYPKQNQNLLISAQWADSTNVTISTITNKAQVLIVQPTANLTLASGTHDTQRITHTFAPTSGTAVVNALTFEQTINQTGGANGISRGLYIAPTLTAAADFRAIETTVGKVCLNTTSGNTMIGTTTDSGAKLSIRGSGGYLSTALALHIRNTDNYNCLSVKDNAVVEVGNGGNGNGRLKVGAALAVGYTVSAEASSGGSLIIGGSGKTLNVNSFTIASGGYFNTLGNSCVSRHVITAAPASIGASSVTNLYPIDGETLKLNDGTAGGINSYYNAGIITIDLCVYEVSLSGNSNMYVGQFSFRFKRYLVNGIGVFTDISAVTNLYNSADATLIGTTLQAIANGANALDLTVTLPATANTASYRMGANVTITKVNYY